MQTELHKILKIVSLAERLKFELRHSWLSNGRQESVAEHTWRVSLMAIMVEPLLSQRVVIEKLLKMIIIHDLVEAEAGDLPTFDTMSDDALKKIKQQNETQAIKNIKSTLDNELGQELYDLWFEFEHKDTYEAKVANALDKLEAQIQHNEADISTWKEIEYEMSFMMEKHVNFEPTLRNLKDLIEADAEKKLLGAGIDLENIKK
ncbi:HAD family hydrolase [Halalkalibacillus sediminis]|uniref:HAD family hydrolase n=1 Tax=Halalkalibacillus sediminis TaxID=2018042 RepID=A0A2I0QTD4_9BACI|nr:HD domain-containing protein [Halalkalibacillus sediminis]PKR77603.1 HAD family hydrolase [Halalkalibacillus sediminis]